MQKQLPRCRPEEAGVSPTAIFHFLDAVRDAGIELHSFMFLRHGKVFAEGWYRPYAADLPHPMYSFTKSLVSLAIGFAEQEGILTLDERLCDLFPDELPETPSDHLRKATIRDLLTMSCGHLTEPVLSNRKTWLKDFFAHPFEAEPGTVFCYNTAGSTVLCAVLRKKTGLSLNRYLKSRLLQPLGITDFHCVKLSDGTEFGGGGGQMTTESLAKVTQFIANRGRWGDAQLLRQSWFNRATAKQIDTSPDPSSESDWAQGYGYQFWRNTVEGSFRCDGMLGQFGVVIPGHDMVAVLTANEPNTQALLTLLWSFLHEIVDIEVTSDKRYTETLRNRLSRISIRPLQGGRSKREKDYAGKTYQKLKGSRIDLKSLNDVLTLAVPEKNGPLRLRFEFLPDRAVLHIEEGGEGLALNIGLQARFIHTTLYGSLYTAVGRWRSNTVFEAEIRALETCGGLRILFKFQDNKLVLEREQIILGFQDAPSITTLLQV